MEPGRVPGHGEVDKREREKKNKNNVTNTWFKLVSTAYTVNTHEVRGAHGVQVAVAKFLSFSRIARRPTTDSFEDCYYDCVAVEGGFFFPPRSVRSFARWRLIRRRHNDNRVQTDLRRARRKRSPGRPRRPARSSLRRAPNRQCRNTFIVTSRAYTRDFVLTKQNRDITLRITLRVTPCCHVPEARFAPLK